MDDWKRRYRCKYEYSYKFGRPWHCWSVVGEHGAVHLHITDYGEDRQFSGDRYMGGIEIHYRRPPEYMQNTPPSQDRCWLLESPCWHDGSSLQASERFIPLWQCDPHNNECMFERICEDADYHFSESAAPKHTSAT